MSLFVLFVDTTDAIGTCAFVLLFLYLLLFESI